VTLGNGTITGSGTLTGTSYTATNTAAAAISESLAGSGTLTMNGAGTLTLSGSNTYTGGTILNSGGINITKANSLGSGNLTMAGGTLAYSGAADTSISNLISVSAAMATIANLTNNTLTLAGGVNLGTNTLNLSGGSFALSNLTDSSFLGGGSLLLSSATATLSGTNTYTGTTTLQGGSTLNLGVANAISTNSFLTLGGSDDGISQINTLNLSGFSQSLTLLNSTGQGIAIVTNSGALATLTVTGNSSYAGSLNGNLDFTVNAGSGTVTLTGTNSSYTGDTWVQSGSLNLGSAAFLSATTNVTVATGSTLLLSGNNNINTSAALTLTGGTLSMGGNGSIRATAQKFASLTLTANSVIDFSSLSGDSSLTFTTIAMNGNNLAVYNWTSTVTRLYDSDTSSLSASDLNNISFFSGGSGSDFLGNGGFNGTEIVPVPEPGVIVAAALLLGWMFFANRGMLMALVTGSNRRSSLDS